MTKTTHIRVYPDDKVWLESLGGGSAIAFRRVRVEAEANAKQTVNGDSK